MDEKNIDKLSKLIEEVSDNRKEYNEMVEKIKIYRSKIEEYIPETKDYRIRTGSKSTIASDKIDMALNIVNTELNVRKNIEASVRTEYELRKKLIEQSSNEENNKNKLSFQDIVKMIEEKEYVNILDNNYEE